MANVTIYIHRVPRALYDALPVEERVVEDSRWKIIQIEEISLTFFPIHE